MYNIKELLVNIIFTCCASYILLQFSSMWSQNGCTSLDHVNNSVISVDYSI